MRWTTGEGRSRHPAACTSRDGDQEAQQGCLLARIWAVSLPSTAMEWPALVSSASRALRVSFRRSDLRNSVICCLLVLLTCGLLAACGRADKSASATAASDASSPVAAHTGFPQGAYIWQRIWTPEHRGVLANSHELFAELRVLAAQLQSGEGWSEVHVDLDALRIDGRDVRPVIRLDGRLPTLDANDIATRSAGVVTDWRAAGVRVDGIEIDFDCPSARLDEYARLLDTLKTKLPHDTTLSITISPDWIGTSALPALQDRADEAVLQLHAVSDPAHGLFDAPQASQFIAQFAALTKKPFRIALPSYGSAADAAMSAASDTTTQPGERHELHADPLAVAKLLRDLEHAHPANLQGVLWFRLPLPGDRRAWPLATLAAVIHAQPLQSKLIADVRANSNGALDLEVANRGTLEAALPAQVEIVTLACPQNDANPLPGYRLERGQDVLRFVRETDATLPASQTRALGWVRCPRLADKDLHVRP